MGFDCFVAYCFFRLRTNAAAMTTTNTTTAPMAMYVSAGVPLVGGCTAWVGDGETDCGGVVVVGGVVVCVGGWVGTTIGATGSETAKAVPASLE